jgi:GTP-binding protein
MCRRDMQGRTQTLNFYRVGSAPGKLILVDAPGYGARGRPEWGEVFDHYVDTRKESVEFLLLCPPFLTVVEA